MIAVNKDKVGIFTFEDEDKEIFQKKKVVQCEVFTLKQQKEKSISIKNWQRVSTVCLFAS